MIDSIRPTYATIVTGVSVASQGAVWSDAIRGWASAVTVVVGVPTSILMLIYWVIKVRRTINQGGANRL